MNEPVTSNVDAARRLESPLAAKALQHLFFSPSSYFRSASLDEGAAWVFAAWISGISSVLDRIDQRLLRAELGGALDNGGTDPVTESWQAFWSVALLAGVLWACWNWWVGGWWYRIRLRWSGASDTNPRQVRMTYTFVTLVVALPAVLYAIAQSIAYPSYRSAWEADSLWDLAIVVCLFWSVVVSWRAVLAVFPVRPVRAVWWFLILPIAAYVVVIGAVGVLFALAGQ